MAKVAFIGLGVMGAPMAAHLMRAGHEVAVFNRTRAKAERWVREHGGRLGDTPAEAARDAEFVFACVGADDDVRRVAAGEEGAFDTMPAGAVFVDHTTTSAALAEELHAVARARGLHFVDAPVSGGQQGAENGQLTIMCGGDETVYERAEPVMRAYARAVRLMGPAGSGQRTKMVNQICIAGLLQGLAEGIHFALRNGMDVEAVLDVISKGAAQSWQMENRGATMARGEFDFGFAVDWMRKDLGICLEEARRAGASLPVTALVDQFYAQLQQRGAGRLDTSSLVKLLEEPFGGEKQRPPRVQR